MTKAVQQSKRDAAAADPVLALPEKPVIPNVQLARLLLGIRHAFANKQVADAYNAPLKPSKTRSTEAAPGRIVIDDLLDSGTNTVLIDRAAARAHGVEVDASRKFKITVANGPTFVTDGATKTPFVRKMRDIDRVEGVLPLHGQVADLGGSASRAKVLYDVVGTLVKWRGRGGHGGGGGRSHGGGGWRTPRRWRVERPRRWRGGGVTAVAAGGGATAGAGG